MTALSNYAENAVLDWLLDTGNATIYVALHTEDPTEAGDTGEVNTGDDTSYARKVVTMGTAADGQSASTTAVSWTAGTVATPFTVTHASLWDDVSGGNCLLKGALTAARNITTGYVLTFDIGEIVATLD